MVLLTSSTVSVIISSGVVCAFTFLLFLCGYNLQQQTVRSLQEALRAPAPPRVIPTLPPQFQHDEDNLGMVVDAELGTVLVRDGPLPAVYQESTTEGGLSLVVQDAVQGTKASRSVLQHRRAISPTFPGVVSPEEPGARTEFVEGHRGHGSEISDDPQRSTDSDLSAASGGHDDGDPASQRHSVVDVAPDPGFVESIPLVLKNPPHDRDAIADPVDRAAYVLALTRPSSLCSALLFCTRQYEQSRLQGKANLIFMYPSTWEISNDAPSTAAIQLLRIAEEKYSVRLHPVVMNSIWLGASTESQLLGEFHTHRWGYDRILYLKSPGLARNFEELDKALRFSNLRASWTKLTKDSAVGDELEPDVILYSSTKGMLSPSGELRKLTTNYNDAFEEELNSRAEAKSAAYVIFNEKELELHTTRPGAYGKIVEQFEQGRRQVCAGTGLLDNGGDGKVDLR